MFSAVRSSIFRIILIIVRVCYQIKSKANIYYAEQTGVDSLRFVYYVIHIAVCVGHFEFVASI